MEDEGTSLQGFEGLSELASVQGALTAAEARLVPKHSSSSGVRVNPGSPPHDYAWVQPSTVALHGYCLLTLAFPP